MKVFSARRGRFALLAAICVSPAFAQDSGTLDRQAAEKQQAPKPYWPYVNRAFPTRPLFGDTHLHTAVSMDAGAFGARLSPADAYRFARGEQVTSSSGQPVRVSRPLDFLVVADHSDNMGFFPDLFAGKPSVLADPKGRAWYELIKEGKGAQVALEIIRDFCQGTFTKALMYAPGTPSYPNKSEYRNPKHETNSKFEIQIPKTKTRKEVIRFIILEFRSFEHCFEFRASNFGFVLC